MPFILTYDVKGLTYYVQQKDGEIRLNGLSDNAFVYEHQWQALQDIPRCKIHLGIPERGALTVRAIPPFEQSNS